MGTNYYLHAKPCPHCGRSEPELHIGKSSCGWVFALHVIPEEGIRDLPDWETRWLKPDSVIKDEYGREVTPLEMTEIITRRTHGPLENKPLGYSSWEHFHRRNQSEAGPNNLLRPKIDGSHCVGHGDGTWSLNAEDFS